MESVLKQEFEYYLANQNDLVKQYSGKFIVIKNRQVLGAYDKELTAIAETQKDHQIGTFLVQFVSPGDAAYKQTFHSRVVFS